MQYTIQSDYDEGITVNYTQPSPGATRSVTIGATGAYIAASPNFDHTEPDLSAVAGWQITFGLTAGTATQWALTGIGAIGTPGVLDGAVTILAARNGSITP